MANLIVAFVVFWVSVPFTTYASFLVKEPSEITGEGVSMPPDEEATEYPKDALEHESEGVSSGTAEIHP